MSDDANKMWGGRFAAGPDAIMEAINASIGFDQRLARQDIEGSRAHAAMLAATGILTDSDAEAIREGLLTVLSEIEAGTFQFSTALEDIHMNVEARLKELIGEPAGRLHTGRSRNDQVATDFRLWVSGSMRCGDPGDPGITRCASGSGRSRGRVGDAGVHAFANRPTGDLGASHDGLCRNAGARCRSVRRCADTDERMPAGGGSFGGNRVSD